MALEGYAFVAIFILVVALAIALGTYSARHFSWLALAGPPVRPSSPEAGPAEEKRGGFGSGPGGRKDIEAGLAAVQAHDAKTAPETDQENYGAEKAILLRIEEESGMPSEGEKGLLEVLDSLAAALDEPGRAAKLLRGFESLGPADRLYVALARLEGGDARVPPPELTYARSAADLAPIKHQKAYMKFSYYDPSFKRERSLAFWDAREKTGAAG